ncbi:MAG: hypothetical protein ACOYOV_10840 [Bacteroidales bacterium]
MSTLYDRFGFNFDSTRFGSANYLSTGASNTINLVANVTPAMASWQKTDLIAGGISRTNYFKNPTVNTVISMLASGSSISVNANICNLFSLQAAADNLIIELNRFKSHTDNISGLVLVTDPSVPSYDTAAGLGQMAIMTLSKVDGPQTNTDPILGCFTSLFIQDILSTNTNQLIVYSTELANSIAANTDNVESITYSSNLAPSELINIENYCLSTDNTLYTRRTLDWTFFQNSVQVMKDSAFLQQFGNMGGTQSYLVKNIIGTDSLVSKLTANTSIT